MRKPKTIDELCDFIIENCDRIAVRVYLDGKWQSLFLTELPTKLAIKTALRFIKEKRIPILLRD